MVEIVLVILIIWSSINVFFHFPCYFENSLFYFDDENRKILGSSTIANVLAWGLYLI